MKNYNFDKPVARRGSGCVKWDEAEVPDVIPMWVADMDFEAAPPIRRALQRRLDHGVFGYTLVPDSYYQAIVDWFSRRHEWTISREWVMYTSGVVPALSAIVKAFTEPGDRVILQTPVYNCFFSSVRNNGCEVVANSLECRVDTHDSVECRVDSVEFPTGLPVPHDGRAVATSTLNTLHSTLNSLNTLHSTLNSLNTLHSTLNSLYTLHSTLNYEIDYTDLEAKCSDERTRLLILCNPHNPVGRVWRRDELQRVADICRRHGVVVVSDEIHNELCFCGRRYVPFGTVDMDNAIICTSPSKSFNIAGLQNANIICKHSEWRQRIDRAINQNEVCDVNPFGVVATEAAYNEGEPWLDALCDYLWQNYQSLLSFFAEEMPQLPVTPLEGTYLVWVDIRPTGLSSDALAMRLLRRGHVQVNSGTMYGAEGFIRINIACPRSQMMEGLRRIAEVIRPTLEALTEAIS